MPQTLAFLQLRWRAFFAVLVLAAFVLPTVSEAACYQSIASTGASAQINTQALPTVVEAAPDKSVPPKAPTGQSGHAAVCQHGHCGHAQAWLNDTTKVEPLSSVGLPLAVVSQERLVTSWLIDGPERPPQA